MRVAIVLGAGGPVGSAFHAGVLRALEDGAGFDARGCELVVGTSAGAQAGALLRAGVTPYDLFARACGEPLTEEGERLIAHLPFAAPQATGAGSLRWPASASYLWSALRRPWRARPGRVVAALLPEGRREPHGEGFARLFARWPVERLWITAVQLD